MRPVALGRKNWLHVGSAHAGPKVAAILSVVESCRRLGVPVKDYLLAVLPGMNQRKLPEIARLTPARWNAPPAPDLDWSDGYASATEILNLPVRLNKEFGKTMVMVTHDPHAAQFASVVRHLEKGELLPLVDKAVR